MAVRLQSPRNWTLRTRLIASVLGLLLVACAAIGAFTDIAVKHRLIQQVDAQLADSGRIHDRGGPLGEPGSTFRQRNVLPPGVPIGSIGISGATGIASVQDGSSTGGAVAANVQQALLAVRADGRPHTVTLPGLGDYRVVSSTDAEGSYVLAFSLNTVQSTLNRITLAIVGLTAIALVLAGLVGALIVRLSLRPLQRITATASRVAEMNLDQGEVALAERVPGPNPHTEVGQVGVALNRLLENVTDALNARHHSEMRVRQFVADASHELRTPLASIRGYAELTRRSRQIAPPDIAHAMGRVEAEASRMTTLVEDLLLLARLDAGRPLDDGEVDLTRLAVDSLSDAHAAGPDHQWSLDLPDEPIMLRGDGPRLHQVILNLLANARTHTPPGTAVKLLLSRTGQFAILSVRDNGPGIPPELMPDIFQRFSRGEQSRSRTAGSTGLGLAIVAAVVAAHGGRIEVTSAPGNTMFTVILPMHGVPQDGSQNSASLAGHAV
jgi:two-component system OmpR family sensor kinase